MRRIGNISEQLASRENVVLAVRNSLRRRSKGNALRRDARHFMADFENNVADVQEILRTGEWNVFGYRTFIRREHGKVRKIDWNPSFRDNVIQHALHQTVGRRLVATFVTDTYSGIEGRGCSYGYKRMRKFLREYGDAQPYCLKVDIRHFYESIDTGILKRMLERKIKDKNALKLLQTLVDSHSDGLPIGNYLSQFLANFYLSDFDHYVQDILGFRHYARYCDDIVVLHEDKAALRDALSRMSDRLAEIGLFIKPDAQVFPVGVRGIDFMGYVFRRFSVRLRKRMERAFRRAALLWHRTRTMRGYRGLASYYGWIGSLPSGANLWNAVVGMPLRKCMEASA